MTAATGKVITTGGSLFAVSGLGIEGIAETRFGG